MEIRQVNVSDSAMMKQEVAKETKKDGGKSETNAKSTPTTEQNLFNRPYGADGTTLSKGEAYNPLSTILPESKMEEARRRLKDEDDTKKRKKKKDEKKKQGNNFWSWLMGDNASTAGDRDPDE
ncbi:MAG: hypothetical protein H7338_12220 [Candidatus Sericytochromatia bacterium]|nr:hypothetical protein [Candidatus Sericytochromatia bacterium]